MGLLNRLRRSEPELREIEIPEGGLDDAGLRKAGKTVLRALDRSEQIRRELDPQKLSQLPGVQQRRPELLLAGRLFGSDFMLLESPDIVKSHIIPGANTVIREKLAGHEPGKEYAAMGALVDLFIEQCARPE